jgi:hypothetical protein
MDFVLRYQGPLPTCGRNETRTKEKDRIRRQISPQLKDLWETHHHLKQLLPEVPNKAYLIRGSTLYDPNSSDDDPPPRRFGHVLLRGWKFIPLVVRQRRWICELKITFLRRHDPGDLVQGGDLDNRLKTLFDGLRLPYQESEVPVGAQSGEDERCFCLLEDDALISDVSIETARLYGPLAEKAQDADVDILMHVRIKKLSRDLGFI